MGLAEGVLEGDEKSAARLITLIENGERNGYEELKQLLPHTGRAHILGITGPAGAGKSTLIGKLAGYYSNQRRKVGIIAIDPTSIRSQGALLGDRARMRDIELSAGIFVRSMADRGHPGGICRAALGTIRVMEALGKDLVMIESVGAGQSDKALFYLCDTVITLFTPEFGDDLQLLKAGLLEIGDIIVINKMDKAGSEEAANAISARIREKIEGQWDVPIFCTRADIGEGIKELADAVDNRWRFLQEQDQTAGLRSEKTISFMMTLLKEELWRRFLTVFHKDEVYEEIIRNVECKIIDPYAAVGQIADIIDERLQRGK